MKLSYIIIMLRIKFYLIVKSAHHYCSRIITENPPQCLQIGTCLYTISNSSCSFITNTVTAKTVEMRTQCYINIIITCMHPKMVKFKIISSRIACDIKTFTEFM